MGLHHTLLAGAAPVKPAMAAGAVRHIPSLDGLRAVSFLLVFVAHAGLDDRVPGGLGVTVFFFLSGFLITTLMRTEYDSHRSVNLKHFWLRRALRILPPFYLVLGTAILLASIFGRPNEMSGRAIGAQLLHVTNYWIIYHGYDGLPAGAGTGVYWSLAVEEHFYLLFPFLYVAMRRYQLSGSRQAGLLMGLCGLILVWRCVLVLLLHVSPDRTYMGSDTRVDSILFGCALAVWHNPVLDRHPISERMWAYGYVPLAAIVLALSLTYRNAIFRETARYSLQGLALGPIFAAAVRFPHWLPFRPLNWRPLTLIGLLSYTLYLLHYGVIFFVQAHFPVLSEPEQGVLSLMLCLGLAWAMYVWVEKPCGRLRRKLSG